MMFDARFVVERTGELLGQRFTAGGDDDYRADDSDCVQDRADPVGLEEQADLISGLTFSL